MNVLCPLDGLVLKVVTPRFRANPPNDEFVRDEHFHLVIDPFEAACPRGHRWRLQAGDVVIERAE